MYGGRHNAISYASISVDDTQLIRQLTYYCRVIESYLQNDPLPFDASQWTQALYTNRLRYKRNWSLAELTEGALQVALESKAIYDAHHNGEPQWRQHT